MPTPPGSASTSISPYPAPPSAPASRRFSATRLKDWVEAVYVYPLPAGGAVDTLKMVVGDRVIVGDIKERQQAKAIYEQASAERAEGGADRTGTAEYLHQFRRQYRSRRNRAGADRVSGNRAAIRQRILAAGADGGRAALQSRTRRCRASTSDAGWRRLGRQLNPIPCRIATASPRCVLDPATNAPVNPTTITVRLQAGFPLGEVKSHHHADQDRKIRHRHAASSGWPKARCPPIAISN